MTDFTLFGHTLSMPTHKVALALRHLKLDYHYRHIDITAPGFIGVNGIKPPDLLAVNRFGQVPAIKHGNIGVTQSNVILRYLSDYAGALGGETPAARIQVDEWLAFEASDLLRAFSGARANLKFLNGHPEVIKGFQQEARDALTKLDPSLASVDFLVGSSMTIADIANFAIASYAEEIDLEISDWPSLVRWMARLERILSLDSTERTLPQTDVLMKNT